MNDVNTQDPQNNPQPNTAPSAPVSAPVSSPAKEAEPIRMSPNSTEHEIQVPQELAEAGVEKVSEKAPLTQEHERIGITHSQKPIETVPAVFPVSGGFTQPLTQQEILVADKKSWKEAIRWLANVISRQLKREQFNKEKTSAEPL